MATTVRYEIEMVPSHPDRLDLAYPTIARIISANGSDVSRGYPDFKEVQEADPSIVAAYNAKVAEALTAAAKYIGSQTTFNPEAYWRAELAKSATYSYTANYGEIPIIPGTQSNFL